MVQEHTRRLAAVWFADISGYTALSGRDEDAALAVVAELQALSTSLVEHHSGRIVKFIGDAVLATFDGTAICIAVHVGEIGGLEGGIRWREWRGENDVLAIDRRVRP